MKQQRITTILHISDTHAQGATLDRIQNLARKYAFIDVVALTGDCTSLSTSYVPYEWNDWPQAVKLAVPGNHDEKYTFDYLTSWSTKPPYVVHVNELAFVGFDNSEGFKDFDSQLSKIPYNSVTQSRAIAVLMHHWPGTFGIDWIGDLIADFARHKPVLVMHGHDHPKGFKGSMWESCSILEDLQCHRSHVCSSIGHKRGLAHLIVWSDGAFTCKDVWVNK